MAHLGVLKALAENKIPVHHISGVSAGAIVGALYGYGHTPDDILQFFKKIKTSSFFHPALSMKGLLKTDIIQKFLQTHIPEDDFSALKIPLTVGATNLRYGRTDYFCSGQLFAPICASSCIPVLFDPLKIGEDWYIDGGILNNLPTKPLTSTCDIIIGIHTNAVPEDYMAMNARQVMERAFMMAIGCNVQVTRKDCHHFIEPPTLGTFRVMDMSSVDVIFDTGYYAMLEYLNDNLII